MFHCLANDAANLVVGGQSANRSLPAWKQVYRSLQHGAAKNACGQGEVLGKFPKEIEDFANHFVSMQKKRHAADYDPLAKFTKSEVTTDIETTEFVIREFSKAKVKDRRAFAALVLFPARKER